MKIIKEFREFAVKGNMFDMAVGIIIGTAFSKVVNSLVNNIIMPPFGYLIGGVNFTELSIVVREATLDETGAVMREAVAIEYGMFIQMTLNFLVVALSIFLVIKAFNSLKKKAENVEDTTVVTPKDIQLLSEIRDLLKK